MVCALWMVYNIIIHTDQCTCSRGGQGSRRGAGEGGWGVIRTPFFLLAVVLIKALTAIEHD